MVKDEILEDERQYLVFVLDNTLYGVDVSFVQTTIKPQPIYLVPGTVEFIKGLINLRGSVVPVVDLRSRFGLNQKELDKKTRFIVVEVGNIMASLIVDAVQGVQTIKENLIEQPSTIVMDTNTKFLQGVARFNNQLILMLNLDLTIRSELVKG
jgi:purine-binding chemotaxis protein CheW